MSSWASSRRAAHGSTTETSVWVRAVTTPSSSSRQPRDRQRHRGPDPRQRGQALRHPPPGGQSCCRCGREGRGRRDRFCFQGACRQGPGPQQRERAGHHGGGLNVLFEKRPSAGRRRKVHRRAKARARAMELLAGQELSSGQLYERLGRKFTQPTAAAVVAEMVERQYVDDESYARTGRTACWPPARAAALPRRICGRRGWTRSRSLLRWKRSTPRTKRAETRSWKPPPPRGRAVPRQAGRRRKDLVVAALARRGFAYPIIKEAIKRVEEEN